MQKEPKVYIILLNYNGWEDTVQCLESLLQLEYRRHQILVVDNNSPDNSLSHLNNWAATFFRNTSGSYYTLTQQEVTGYVNSDRSETAKAAVIFIKAEINGGFAAGNNIALRFAATQPEFAYAWLLNNDTTVEKNTLTELVKRAQHDEKTNQGIGIWGSKLLHYSKPEFIQAIGGKFNLATFTTKHIAENEPDNTAFNVNTLEQDYVIGASMFVSKKFIDKVGLLCEDYFLYFEELDWARRGIARGFKLGYVWSSRVYHKEGNSIGSSSEGSRKSSLSDYHGIRSKIIFIRKFYPERTAQLYLILAGSVILRLKRLQFKRAQKVLLLMLKKN